jgi:hypothetical protein
MFSCCICSESCVSPLDCDAESSALDVVLAPPLEECDVIVDADGPSTTDPPEGCTEAVLSWLPSHERTSITKSREYTKMKASLGDLEFSRDVTRMRLSTIHLICPILIGGNCGTEDNYSLCDVSMCPNDFQLGCHEETIRKVSVSSFTHVCHPLIYLTHHNNMITIPPNLIISSMRLKYARRRRSATKLCLP